MGLKEITMIGLGPTIGSTIFLLVGGGIGIAGPALILVFILNFFVTLLTAMAYAELGSAFSDTGGGYIWVKDGMPQPFGFLAGWLSWFGHAIVTAFYVVGFGYGVIWLMQAYGLSIEGATPELIIKVLAVIACAAFIAINYKGTKTTGRSGFYITGALIAIVVVYILLGFVYMFGKPDLGTSFHPFILSPGSGGEYSGATSIFIAMGFTFIVFEGYEIIAQCGEECKDAEKNIPKASLIAISISAAIFILVAVVTVGVTGWQNAAAFGENAVAEIAEVSMPGWGLQLIGIGVIIGSLAAVNSTLFSSSRVAYAMGRDGAIPRSFGTLHDVRKTPHVAIFISGGIIIALTVFLPIRQIVVAADIMFLMLMTFVNMAVITLRVKHPEIRRRYVMPLFPLIPIIGLLANGIMAYSLWKYEPLAWYMAMFWIIVGLLAYLLYTKKEAIVDQPDAAPHVEVTEKHAGSRYRAVVAISGPQDMPIVELAALVSRAEGGEVQLVHVIEVAEGKPLDSVSYGLVSRERKALSQARRLANDMGAHIHSKVIASRKASDAIVDEAKAVKASAIFMGWRGTHGPGGVMGSNIDKVVQNAPCDVIIYKSKVMPEEVNRILVVVTGEGNEKFATGTAVLLAKRYKASITIAPVRPEHSHNPPDGALVASLAEVCAGQEIQSNIMETLYGDDAVVKASNEHDVVVVGAADESRIMQFVFGSFQNRLAERVENPLVIVQKVNPSEERVPESLESGRELLHAAADIR
jgi:amino acid transporter/nucleotide-binding universal stress UspA family protein